MTATHDPARDLPEFRRLRLDRPLAFLALRATGDDPDADRLVEVAVLRADPGPAFASLHTPLRVEPLTPRLAASPYVLTGRAARGVPRFADVAGRVLELLDRADLAGFDLLASLPLLAAELGRCGLALPLAGRGLVDVGAAYREQEPRDLPEAARHYLGVRLFPLFGAGVEARLTASVLEALLARDPTLPCDPRGLQDFLGELGSVPALLGRGDGGWVLGWGRFSGRPLREVAEASPGYLRWLLTRALGWRERGAVAAALARAGEPATEAAR